MIPTDSSKHKIYLANPYLVITLLTLAWAALMVTVIYTRPLLPVIETRYSSIAWEMWVNHHYLFPLQNGQPYADKPPLLFWLIIGGWHIFGVNAWWPRLLPPLFGYLNAWMSYLIARQLWPEQPQVHLSSLILLLGSLAWGIYSNILLFDIVLSFFVLLSWHGLLRAHFHNEKSGWIYFSLGIGLGIITKGPIVLIFTLAPALILPYFIAPIAITRKRFYGYIALASLIGIILALLWAIPAALQAGPQYSQAIFISQSIGRLSTHTHLIHRTHHKPFWWYSIFLPFYLAPWLFYPPLWRAFLPIKQHWAQPVLRFLIASIVTIFVILSLVGGKQIHYLLPLLPFCMLLFAYLLNTSTIKYHPLWLFNSIILLTGIGLWIMPLFLPQYSASFFLQSFTKTSAVIIFSYALLLFLFKPKKIISAQLCLSLSNIILLILIHLFIMKNLYSFYDLTPIARFISTLQQTQHRVAIMGPYEDQYQFLGRLEYPLKELHLANVIAWSQDHPRGWVVVTDNYVKLFNTKPKQEFNYLSKRVWILPTHTLLQTIQKSNSPAVESSPE